MASYEGKYLDMSASDADWLNNVIFNRFIWKNDCLMWPFSAGTNAFIKVSETVQVVDKIMDGYLNAALDSNDFTSGEKAKIQTILNNTKTLAVLVALGKITLRVTL